MTTAKCAADQPEQPTDAFPAPGHQNRLRSTTSLAAATTPSGSSSIISTGLRSSGNHPFGVVNQLATCQDPRGPRTCRTLETMGLGRPVSSNWNAGYIVRPAISIPKILPGAAPPAGERYPVVGGRSIEFVNLPCVSHVVLRRKVGAERAVTTCLVKGCRMRSVRELGTATHSSHLFGVISAIGETVFSPIHVSHIHAVHAMFDLARHW